VNAEQVAALRMLLAPTGWLERAAEFTRIRRGSARTPGGLLLVGTPEHERWHFAAHLDDESRLAGDRLERPHRLRARLARLLDTVSGPVSP
jgi:hypothetical protein